MNETPAIELEVLTKRYPGSAVDALREVSLTVNTGQVYGFLGANGAGKSTTIRTLMNFVQPTRGTARILGMDIVQDSVAVKREVGYLGGELSLYRGMTGRQFLHYMGELHPVKHTAYQKYLIELFDADLRPQLGTLSKGNRQKFGLIQAFMHEPKVLILDEPTSGLDPLMQEAFFGLIRKVQHEGTAVFVSSHNFTEVLRMCDRVGFIREGKLVAEESIAKLQAKAAHNFVINFTAEAPLEQLRAIPHAKVTVHDPHHIRIHMQGELTPLFAVLAKHQVAHFDAEEVNLEQEFLRFYQKKGHRS